MPNPIADPLVEGVDTDAQSRLVLIEATPEGVATVTINRADRRNAFNAEVIAALREAFETLEGADGVRVIFITGAGGVFSAGADLEWMRDAIEHTEADNREDAMEMARMLKHLHSLPMLTVALVEGGAFGGGAGLAAACDMAIATSDARFAFSEVKLGLVAATVSPYVVAAVGPRRARGLFALGRSFDAIDAQRFGLVDMVVDGPEGLARAREGIVADIMACGPEAVGESKRLVDHVANHAIDHGIMTDTAHWIARVRVGSEGQAGVRAFLEGQPPSWALTDAADDEE
ncbi:MAG TPA: enoyl-CoA hydratase-related protein [Caulobacteraceae bacterium]|nr:enoyl-CoA hydratase-related protein [Caulobacteraceae bacterium]